MATRLIEFVSLMRMKKGSFFISRLRMRLKFDPEKQDLPDSQQNLAAMVDACRAVGYAVPPDEMP